MFITCIQINKSEAERLCSDNGTLSIPLIQYTLTPDQHLELYVPRVTVNATGADERLSFDLTLKSPGICSNQCVVNIHVGFRY